MGDRERQQPRDGWWGHVLYEGLDGATVGVGVAGRFVGEDDLGSSSERTGDCHSLLLAAPQLRRSVTEPVPEADRVNDEEPRPIPPLSP
jgi:hypothetical protein